MAGRSSPDPRDETAFGAFRVAVGAKTDYFSALVERLDMQRHSRRGQPPLWVQRLRGQPTADLAGAILYNLIRAAVWAENEANPRDPPLLSTVATNVGADLLGYEAVRDLPVKVGVQLLDIAREVGIMEINRDWSGGSIRVRITDNLFRFMRHVVNRERDSIQSRRPIRPPATAEVRTRKPADMLLERVSPPFRVMEAVEKLQGTAWRINRAVLGMIGSDAETRRATGLAETDEDERHLRERQWILGEADVLASLQRFHIPMHLDFRGRVYQGRGLLTYTDGNDVARGLLEFADGERLNADGIRWLAWHAAQMWGRDLPEMALGDGTPWLRTATTLMEEDRWRDAEHPVQFLAAALALVDAQGGRPVHLPVRVDATCSGLQQLALLARDTDLARTVNLWGENINYDRSALALVEPPRGKDFYGFVATAAGFSRQEAKAVVVPLLYGAGVNALGQKLAQLRRRDEPAQATAVDKRDARAIRSVAEELAPRAFDVLRWFKQVAAAHNAPSVEKGAGERVPIRWTTASGFEVAQDYRYLKKQVVKVEFDGRRVGLVLQKPGETICPWQQELSIRSSVVHSMDAALLTEIVALAPIDGWAVAHDAFGVPANQVWALLRASEEALRVIYTTDWLAEWTKAWRARGIDVPNPPEHSERLPPEMLKGLRMLG